MTLVMDELISLLDAEATPYEVIHHRRDYTAQETAADTHTPGRKFAKTVMLWIDGSYALAVLPAHKAVDTARLRKELGAKQIVLASEAEIAEVCPDCEVGALPPFGNFYNLPVYLDMKVANDDQITFNAGTHRDAIRMRYGDFVRLAGPKLLTFAKEDNG